MTRHSCLYPIHSSGHISTLYPGSSHQPRHQLAASVPSPQVAISIPPIQDHPISPGFKLLNKIFPSKILRSAQFLTPFLLVHIFLVLLVRKIGQFLFPLLFLAVFQQSRIRSKNQEQEQAGSGAEASTGSQELLKLHGSFC